MNGIGYGNSMFLATHGILAKGGTPAPVFNQYSMLLDGVDEYFNIANPTSFTDTGNFSISAWVKYTTTSSLYILSIRDNRFLYVNTGKIVGAYRNSAGSFISITSPSLYNNNNWHHVLFVKNSTNLILFVDGIQVISNSSGGATQSGGSSFARISARAFNATPTNYYNGLVDEIAFFQSDQSANISTIYNSGVPTDLTSLSPLSWWRMGDGDTWGGTNWTLIDNGSGGNDATSVNMEQADRVTDVP